MIEYAIALNGLNKFLNKESNLESSLSTPKLILPTDLIKLTCQDPVPKCKL